MKKFLLLILICFAQNVFSQTLPKADPNSSNIVAPISSIATNDPDETVGDNSIHSLAGIEVRPEFPGGKEALYRFIKENYKTPEEDGLKGKVYMTFIIEKDGTLSDLKVIRDIGYGTGAEAIRVIKTSPKWIPGQ
jgi:periplasmic protein TonB